MRFDAKFLATAALAAPLALGMATGHAQDAQQNQGAAQQGQQNQQAAVPAQNEDGIVALNAWRYDDIYAAGGMRADELLEAEVYGATGEEIGDIENVILDENNRIVAVIAEVGGFWDIGDTHVAVPWDQVELVGEGLEIPVTEENVEEYGLYAEDSIVTKDLAEAKVVGDETWTGPRTWKLTNLIDNFAVLEDGTGYGYIVDAVISREGELQAVLVEPSYGYGVGPVAYPFYGYGYDYGWRAGAPYYRLPYGERDVVEVEPFEYDRYQGIWD